MRVSIGVVIAIISSNTANAQECFQWREEVTTSELGWRRFESVVFDSIRNQSVIVGGYPYGYPYNYSNETLGWDGSQWTLLTAGGIPPRSFAGTAFDSDRGVMVLFGGMGDANTAHGGPYGDTWEWDGKSWFLRATTGPAPRMGHCMAYDSNRRVTVLFGGSGEFGDSGTYGFFGTTWEWDGESWTLVNGEGPPARSHYMCAFDKRRGVFVVHGGCANEDCIWARGDTWEWDGQNWEFGGYFPYQLRMLAAMAYDDERGTCVMHGGMESVYDSYPYSLGDTIEWDGHDWKQVSAPPLPHAYHSMVYDSARKRMVVVGGLGTEDKLFELIRVDDAADADSDCDADLLDLAKFQACIGAVVAGSECAEHDVDQSGSIDTTDFAEWFYSFSGPGE